jgi:hypothetical protein
VRTRRYAGEDATDAANNAKLLEALATSPRATRGALRVRARAGTPRRRGAARWPAARHRPRDLPWPIATEPRGTRGFGYDRSSSRVRDRPAAGRSGCGTTAGEARHLAPRPGQPGG